MIREMVWFFQKLFKGYSDYDLWGLDSHLSELISIRLKAFIKHGTMSHPTSFKNNKEWIECINKMIWAFENWDKDDYCFNHHGEMKFGKSTNGGVTVPIIDTGYTMDKNKLRKHEEKVVEGLNLFAEYFRNLWD